VQSCGRPSIPRPSRRCTQTRPCTARKGSASRTWAWPASAAINEQFPAVDNIECWFGQPIVSGDRAAVEWWGSWTEQGQELTFAGLTVLRFGGDGRVIEHRDYFSHVEQRQPPYPDW
jgi:hypothetical protein